MNTEIEKQTILFIRDTFFFIFFFYTSTFIQDPKKTTPTVPKNIDIQDPFNVHRFTLNLQGLKIMVVESFPSNITY